MTCVHLRKLYQLCQSEDLKLSSSDLIHIVCEQCGKHEVCPSLLTSQGIDGPEADQLNVNEPENDDPS